MGALVVGRYNNTVRIVASSYFLSLAKKNTTNPSAKPPVLVTTETTETTRGLFPLFPGCFRCYRKTARRRFADVSPAGDLSPVQKRGNEGSKRGLVAPNNNPLGAKRGDGGKEGGISPQSIILQNLTESRLFQPR